MKINSDEDFTKISEDIGIFQKTNGFRFSVDAILLSDFFNPSKYGKTLDIGTGNGIIPILLAMKDKADSLIGIDILESNIDLARRNAELNLLNDKIEFLCCDINLFDMGNSFDYVISNPPYMKLDGKKQNIQDEKSIARHEITLNLEDLVANAKRVLKPIGHFYMVHRSYRLSEVITCLEKYNFSIKTLRFVHFSEDKSSNLFLVEATKGKKSKLEIVPPLFLEKEGY